MKSHLYIICVLGLSLSSCAMVQESMDALEYNRQAIDISTHTINENTIAIEEANATIAENKRQLSKINETLKKAGEG